jgi:hypothetical protein
MRPVDAHCTRLLLRFALQLTTTHQTAPSSVSLSGGLSDDSAIFGWEVPINPQSGAPFGREGGLSSQGARTLCCLGTVCCHKHGVSKGNVFFALGNGAANVWYRYVQHNPCMAFLY